jgi:hypothetical protein
MRIVKPDGSVIEGTAAELAEFEAMQRFHETRPGIESPTKVGKIPTVESAETEDWEYASADLAFRVLTRLRLSKEQREMLALIYAGGDAWTSATDIQKKIGYKPSQFAGLMGAFGRRFVNTPGYVLHSAFFEQEWDADRSCYLYRFPPSVRTAVEKARIVDGE